MLLSSQTLQSAEASQTDRDINLAHHAQLATKQQKVLIIYFTATYCSFCKRLNNDVIQPMYRNEGYRNKVILREIVMDEQSTITDFNGKATDVDDLASKYNIQATPTLIFVDEKGNEIAERLEGYQSVDFYWYYLDKSIDSALAKIK